MTSETDWNAAVDFAQRELGAVNVLVNNAAVLHVAALVDTTPKEFERVLRVNLYGPSWGFARSRGPCVRPAALDREHRVDRCTARHERRVGLLREQVRPCGGLTKAAALELGRSGIRVNTVCPATGSREMILPFLPEAEESLRKMAANMAKPTLVHAQPISQDERLAEIARMVGFLASDESLSCTGADYPVDAGFSAGKIIEGAPGS